MAWRQNCRSAAGEMVPWTAVRHLTAASQVVPLVLRPRITASVRGAGLVVSATIECEETRGK